MKRGLVLAVLAASLLLTACSSEDEYDGGPAVTEGQVIGKRITEPNDPEPCYRLTLSRTDRVKNKKTKHYESRVAIGYQCVPTARWEALEIGDMYP